VDNAVRERLFVNVTAFYIKNMVYIFLKGDAHKCRRCQDSEIFQNEKVSELILHTTALP
jgi:hypothetical protein